MRHKAAIAVIILIVGVIGAFAFSWWRSHQAPQVQPTYNVEVAFPNVSFDQPVGVYNAGDGSNRIFVLERKGVIQVFENLQNVNAAAVFLDISDRVISEAGEEGLLGLAFHPSFSINGFFYVDYTAGNPLRTVIARYSISQDNVNQADRNSEQVLLEIPQPFDNHNGGQLAFGPDGYLYIAMGDGGGAGDPHDNAQNLSTLLGKILRIDVDRTSGSLKYGIPSDNSFAGNTQGYREEIFAYGLRNPWRFSFDAVTGWLWAGDVGQNRVEEIDIIEEGKNYGWNVMEGSLCYNPSQNCNQTGLQPPILTYGHDLGISITGGFVYRGSRLLGLTGWYVYGDFGSGRIWALEYGGVNPPVNKELVNTDLSITSFGLDEDNELYVCDFGGKIHRLAESTIVP